MIPSIRNKMNTSFRIQNLQIPNDYFYAYFVSLDSQIPKPAIKKIYMLNELRYFNFSDTLTEFSIQQKLQVPNVSTNITTLKM
jgi:hypothetical protein